jgi:hypothetical protein
MSGTVNFLSVLTSALQKRLASIVIQRVNERERSLIAIGRLMQLW